MGLLWTFRALNPCYIKFIIRDAIFTYEALSTIIVFPPTLWHRHLLTWRKKGLKLPSRCRCVPFPEADFFVLKVSPFCCYALLSSSPILLRPLFLYYDNALEFKFVSKVILWQELQCPGEVTGSLVARRCSGE